MGYEVRPVAFVRSTRHELDDDRWDDETTSIELADGVPDAAIVGLDGFSHVMVVFVFDRAHDVPPAPWTRHPRGNVAWPELGVFAQRAKDRPNRLGVSVCRLGSASGRTLRVEGLDAVDGTPVVDLKPWVVQFGPRGQVTQPAWIDELMTGYFEAT